MTTKLKIKYGAIEIECEGSEEFLRAEIPLFLEKLSTLKGPKTETEKNSGHAEGNDAESLSVTTIAQRLSVDSGPSLIEAACLNLARAGNKVFTKKQVLKTMRDTPEFFKSSYASNFDANFKRLVTNGRINHSGGDNYAMSPATRTELEAKLAVK